MRMDSAPSFAQILWLAGSVREILNNTAGPWMTALTGPFPVPSPKKTSLLCWEENPEPAWRDSGLATKFVVYDDLCADGIAMLFCSLEAEGDRGRKMGPDVLQQAELRGIAVFYEDFEAAVVG